MDPIFEAYKQFSEAKQTLPKVDVDTLLLGVEKFNKIDEKFILKKDTLGRDWIPKDAKPSDIKNLKNENKVYIDRGNLIFFKTYEAPNLGGKEYRKLKLGVIIGDSKYTSYVFTSA